MFEFEELTNPDHRLLMLVETDGRCEEGKFLMFEINLQYPPFHDWPTSLKKKCTVLGLTLNESVFRKLM
jgi:hypothetical protein